MFVRYNSTLQFWEYDSSGGVGAGPWVKLPVDASKLIGVVPPASLPANVALKDQPNVFTANQNINLPDATLFIKDTAQPVDNGLFRIINTAKLLIFQAVNDAVTASPGNFYVSRLGNIFTTGSIAERSRGVPMGEWQNEPYNAANYGAAAGTWTVAVGNVQTSRYTLIGKTLIWTTVVFGTTISNSTDTLYIKLPNNFDCPVNLNIGATNAAYINNGGVPNDDVMISGIGTGKFLRILNLGRLFSVGNLDVYFTWTGEIA